MSGAVIGQPPPQRANPSAARAPAPPTSAATTAFRGALSGRTFGLMAMAELEVHAVELARLRR